jgi:hypothetical protein
VPRISVLVSKRIIYELGCCGLYDQKHWVSQMIHTAKSMVQLQYIIFVLLNVGNSKLWEFKTEAQRLVFLGIVKEHFVRCSVS